MIKALLSKRAGGIVAPPSISWHAAFWAADPSWSNPGNGNAVSSWRDYSGNSRTLSQTSTRRPTYRSSVSALNNQAAVEFDGSNDWMQTAAWTDFRPASYVVIFNLISVPASIRAVCDGLDNSGHAQALYYDPSAATKWQIFDANAVGTSSVVATTGAKGIRYSLGSLGGVCKVNGTGTVSGFVTGSANCGGLTLGSARVTQDTYAINMACAFMGVYSGDVTAAGNWSSFATWANTNYGVTLA